MIEAQIVYSKLQAVCRQMGEALQRISRSPLVSQDRAFATAIFTNELKLAIQHQYEPEHLYAMKDSVDHLFDYFSFDISDGDILLVADPYNGGTKGQTLTMVAPLFYHGELVLFPAVRVQIADLAGEFPGGFNPDAFEIWQESMRITPVKLYKQGLLQQDVLRFLLANSRVKSLYQSELDAMYACLRYAQKELQRLIKQYGQRLIESVYTMTNYSNRRIVEHISQYPKKTMDSKITFASNGENITIYVSINTSTNQVAIDFNGTGMQVNTPVNASLSTTKAFATWPILAPLADEIAINEGVLEAFEIHVPKGSLLNPDFPASVGFSTFITGHFISGVITKALQQGNTSTKLYSKIHGPGPQAILFSPFGMLKETVPLFLVPGYPESSEGWGPSALFGDRELVSAEELEFNYGFKMVKREKKANQMIVEIINENFVFNVITIIPEVENNTYGNITIQTNENRKTFHKSSTGISIRPGNRLEFVYERTGGQ
ncbi:hydantoinase B/oxoprolinase family protein [Gracilibacillus dipsosauri]|uniref:Methylhydantoinase n=1 Tax=Gracilibacillus dipsosauri TaxID=178340 RepID=A0A317KXZ0_9BACI|nr:hydantoinase B/oxoprolinase family protein [Gracilibacillus dipsosauri]PWU67600.1 methylhydantoinase [Gracilibacillus dipsosauri]